MIIQAFLALNFRHEWGAERIWLDHTLSLIVPDQGATSTVTLLSITITRAPHHLPPSFPPYNLSSALPSLHSIRPAL